MHYGRKLGPFHAFAQNSQYTGLLALDAGLSREANPSPPTGHGNLSKILFPVGGVAFACPSTELQPFPLLGCILMLDVQNVNSLEPFTDRTFAIANSALHGRLKPPSRHFERQHHTPPPGTLTHYSSVAGDHGPTGFQLGVPPMLHSPRPGVRLPVAQRLDYLPLSCVLLFTHAFDRA